MAKRYSKGLTNPYCNARLTAAINNNALSTRRNTAALLNVDESTLARYELGTARAPLDTVLRMAELYNSPELLNAYCSHECPLGCGRVCSLELRSLETLAIKIHNSSKEVGDISDGILIIAENGEINDDERPRFLKYVKQLKRLSLAINELLLYIEKTGMEA